MFLSASSTDTDQPVIFGRDFQPDSATIGLDGLAEIAHDHQELARFLPVREKNSPVVHRLNRALSFRMTKE